MALAPGGCDKGVDYLHFYKTLHNITPPIAALKRITGGAFSAKDPHCNGYCGKGKLDTRNLVAIFWTGRFL
jgi:hypothetical protein